MPDRRCGRLLSVRSKIGADYLQRMVPTLKERLAVAGRRLATLLNNSLAGL